ncbi:glycoside hydrolase family 43 protein [Zunongwangia atlantica]|uniref:Glycoside hydrolase family 43 n=1 Tax=Zunongwangia atlantica 22II14-10F7 TaxID=1185767 RepID=A0A1Y1T935_9FLAO|nr:glycoside hydrolase 43 family protein [Zunongwangia atlantica]ORL47084.1 glycoside hydrolase family 43 [Zunongwangia atlantica 22II14-10F7]
MRRSFVIFFSLLIFNSIYIYSQSAQNPVIFADVPDVSTIRVGDTYYMSSTTMHMSPGLPIMKSKDLINWEMAGYAYDRLVENDKMNLENNEEAYGKGSWASSLRFHDGYFYVSTFSATTGKTHVYKTDSIEKGNWESYAFEPVLHDNSLFFDDDGKVYMIYGGGEIKLIELLPDASGIKPGGIQKTIIENVNMVFGEDEVGGLPGEGSQVFKIDGKYYIFHIASPKSKWARSVIIHKADKITGPYEGRLALQDDHVAQGGIVNTTNDDWYAMLFGDRGSIGRIPYLVPVEWKDGWPVLGENGKVPETLELPNKKTKVPAIVASDDFERKPGDTKLPLVWQWNHNPDNDHWEILENPGRLRITTGRIDANLQSAKNTLTQRTIGPKSSATTKINVANMKDGDIAGLTAFQNKYAYVGVKKENGKTSIVMVKSILGIENEDKKQGIVMMSTVSENFEAVESTPLNNDEVFLKVSCDFTNDKAEFYYSLDGENWQNIGGSLQMLYTFTKHFMGYRYGLFNYATEQPGGYVDFDFYTIEKN